MDLLLLRLVRVMLLLLLLLWLTVVHARWVFVRGILLLLLLRANGVSNRHGLGPYIFGAQCRREWCCEA